jgi:pectin methylesterase-like acyl-CoA thioesterase
VFHFAAHTLAFGTSYFVTVDRGVVTSREEPSFAVTDSSAWRFATSATAPALSGEVGVATDGSRPFCSLQGALDAVAKVTAPVVVTLAAGTYHEIVHATGRHGLTVSGADRKTTKVSWVNNDALNAGTSARGLFTIEQSTSVTLENFTIENLTPQGGTQAEALRFGACDQCIVRSADVHSLQDTVMLEGRVFLTDCLITGNVDFVWGRGIAYFSNCEIKTVGRAGPIVQSRNDVGAYGYVFVDSTLSSDPGLTGGVLARIDASVFPGSQVAYVGCKMGPHITPAGWTITGATPPATLRFWEFGSTDLSGNALDTSQRLSGSTRITADQATMLRDPKVVLGGWSPQ